MATSKIKKGDTVRIIAGTDKKKTGKVLSVQDGKVKVEGVNLVKKHTKPSQSNPKGGIIEEEAAIDISNVMYVVNGNVSRIGFQGDKKNKVRVAKSTGEVID